MSDRLVALLLLAVCGFFYWQTFSIRRAPFAAFETFDAATFPRVVIALLALFSVVLLLRGSGPVIARVTRADTRRWLVRYRLPLLSLLAFALYAALLSPLGWTLS